MKYRMVIVIASVALITSICVYLRADESPQAGAAQSAGAWQNNATSVWVVQNYASIAKDPEAMGIAAVEASEDLVRDQTPEAQTEYFNKMLFNAKSHAVQRAIRMKLAQLYQSANRTSDAMDQLQVLITDSQ
jgi:hypothetical protein